jgi:hypothetical protein
MSVVPVGPAITGSVAGTGVAYVVSGRPVVALGGSLAGVGVAAMLVCAVETGVDPDRARRQFLTATGFAVLVVSHQAVVGTTPQLGTVPLLVAYASFVVYGMFVVSGAAWRTVTASSVSATHP